MRSPLEILQPVGRALMLPIAVLPAAGLMLRLGQPDLLDIAFMAAAGDAIFSNLGLLFAIGVAVGLARENHGAAGLAGVVCFLIATKGGEALLTAPPAATAGFAGAAADLAAAAFKAKALAKLSVPIGIISGLIGGLFYNRFSRLELPEYLAFFGGRRFVPIISGVAGLGLALIVGLGDGAINGAMDALSRAIVGSGPWGLFVYGALNRLLIVTGLHHILNNIAFFVVGDYHGATGDLRRFFAGDPTAGAFMSGFFPVMMFGLPAACLAMYRSARPERRKEVGGMLLSLALTSFLTGVTEPIEFSFMFLAPMLYAAHAVLTGLAMAIMDVLQVRLGFGFSAGLLDYGLNLGKATHPLTLLPVGLAYALVYYGLFRFCIERFDLKTPGREPLDEPVSSISAAGSRGERFIAALGGATNIVVVDACTTRLRLMVEDQGKIDEPALKSLGSRGVVRPSDKAVQVVLGPVADQVAQDIRSALDHPAARSHEPSPATRAAASQDAADLLAALGGRANLIAVSTCGSRLVAALESVEAIDEAALVKRGVRALVRTSDRSLHVVLGPDAEREGKALEALLVD